MNVFSSVSVLSFSRRCRIIPTFFGIFSPHRGKIGKKGLITMKMSNAEYSRYVDSLAPKSKCVKNCFNAFWIGGLICTLGQLLKNGYMALGMTHEISSTAVSITLVFLSAILTGFSVYDDIAKLAGAGTLVPITGFANSVVAPAVEFQTEGIVLGTCAKMFTIAGPVLVYGTAAGFLYGLIYWVCSLF